MKTTSDIYQAEDVILATGAERTIPKIAGITEFEAKMLAIVRYVMPFLKG